MRTGKSLPNLKKRGAAPWGGASSRIWQKASFPVPRDLILGIDPVRLPLILHHCPSAAAPNRSDRLILYHCPSTAAPTRSDQALICIDVTAYLVRSCLILHLRDYRSAQIVLRLAMMRLQWRFDLFSASCIHGTRSNDQVPCAAPGQIALQLVTMQDEARFDRIKGR